MEKRKPRLSIEIEPDQAAKLSCLDWGDKTTIFRAIVADLCRMIDSDQRALSLVIAAASVVGLEASMFIREDNDATKRPKEKHLVDDSG